MRVLIVSALIALAAAACGGATDAADPPTTAGSDGPMPVMAPGVMGDPEAIPARDVAGATLEVGTFVSVGGAAGLRGEAVLARHDGGTTLTVSLEDLPATSDFVGHVHTGACADGGGPHYRHDPAGPDLPPNEIHIAVTTDVAGAGVMTVENAIPATRDAASVVIHAVGGDKLGCADLVPTSP